MALDERKPLLVLLFGVAIGVLIGIGKSYERKVRDRVRAIWQRYRARTLPPAPARSTLRQIRVSAPYQWILYLLKWRVLPTFFGILTLLVIFYAIAFVVTQFKYGVVEPRNSFCLDRADTAGGAEAANVAFRTKDHCTDLKTNVKAEQLYRLDLTVKKDWHDDGHAANPAKGVLGKDELELMWAFRPFRRVTSASYLKPMIEVRTHDIEKPWRKFLKPILGPDIDVRKTRFRDHKNGLYSMDFWPQADRTPLLIRQRCRLAFHWRYVRQQWWRGGGERHAARQGVQALVASPVARPLDEPARRRAGMLAVAQHQHAVDQHMDHPDRILLGFSEGRAVGDLGGIEYGDVGEVAGLQRAAVGLMPRLVAGK